MHVSTATPTAPVSSLRKLLSHVLHAMVYVVLFVQHRIHRLLDRLPFQSLHFLSSKPTSVVVPTHLALSGVLLPSSSTDSNIHIESLSSLASLIHAAFAAGARHLTLHDVFLPVPIDQLLLALAPADGVSDDRAMPCVITEITHDVTRRATVDLCAPLSSPSASPSPSSPMPPPSSTSLASSSPDSRQWTHATVDEPYAGDVALHLTVVHPRSGRACMARAARKLARERLAERRRGTIENEMGDNEVDELSVQAVQSWLDRDGGACMLPSEPDVLITFPPPHGHVVRVLRDFPMWQLRLTQLVFAEHAVSQLSARDVLNMAAHAASAPCRFGR